MTRYSHFMVPTRGDRQPASWLAVAVGTSRTPSPSGRGRERDELGQWSAIHTWKDSRGRPCRAAYSGGTAEGFWRFVADLCGRGGRHWIFTDRSSLTWGVLELWQRLETGALELIGTDPRTSPRQSGRRRKQPGGVLVLEDPPVIIECRPAGTSGRLKIVDVANYGYSGCPSITRGCTGALNISNFVTAMIDTLESRGLGSLQATAASQAFYSWKRKHLTRSVYVHTNPVALRLERASLFGGRNECFRVGRFDGKVYALDFTAFYPSLLLRAQLPAQLLYTGGQSERGAALPSVNAELIIADVTLETEEPCAPHTYRGEVVYPVGRWRAVLCGPELDLVRQHGRIVQVHGWAVYRGSDCGSDFAREWLDIRMTMKGEGNVAGEAWAKRVGNSLHGKMGQHNCQWVDLDNEMGDEPYSTWYERGGDGCTYRYRSVAWQVQRQIDLGEHNESCPAIAGWVTSLGRAALWRALDAAGRGNVLYTDTDSLFVTEEGFANLCACDGIGTGEPGRLRLQGVYPWAEFWGLKWYAVPGKVVCSGKPAGQYEPGPLDVGYRWRQGIKDSIRNHHRPRAESVVRKYHRRPGYQHGVVRLDGRVDPLEVWQ